MSFCHCTGYIMQVLHHVLKQGAIWCLCCKQSLSILCCIHPELYSARSQLMIRISCQGKGQYFLDLTEYGTTLWKCVYIHWAFKAISGNEFDDTGVYGAESCAQAFLCFGPKKWSQVYWLHPLTVENHVWTQSPTKLCFVRQTKKW